MSTPFQKIANVARSMGAEQYATRKWQYRRKIPDEWKIRLVRSGHFSFEDLEGVAFTRSAHADGSVMKPKETEK